MHDCPSIHRSGVVIVKYCILCYNEKIEQPPEPTISEWPLVEAPEQPEPVIEPTDQALSEPAEDMAGDNAFAANMSRRAFLGRAAQVAAAVTIAESADVQYSREYIWNDDAAHLTFMESPYESARKDAYVFMMGLGVPNSSTAIAANSQKPMLDTWGNTAYMAPPQTGLTPGAFKVMAEELGTQLAERNVETVHFICQSAGFDNAVRMLNAPVWQQASFFGRGIGRLELARPANEYWQEQYGLRIGNVIAASSPMNLDDVQPGPRREVTRAVGNLPTDFIQGGFGAKLLGNLANNHTLDVHKFQNETDRLRAAYESARNDNSPRNWGTQLPVLALMTPEEVQNAFSIDTRIAVVAARDPRMDDTVVTDGLRARTALFSGQPVERIIYRDDPAIRHGNIAEEFLVYRRLFNDVLVTMHGINQH